MFHIIFVECARRGKDELYIFAQRYEILGNNEFKEYKSVEFVAISKQPNRINLNRGFVSVLARILRMGNLLFFYKEYFVYSAC